MSQYIPRAAVMRETWSQARRRIHIEKLNAEPITLLKERLKEQSTIVPELLELGLTEKHARNLEGRLQFLNQQEEKLKGEKAPVVDPEKIQEAAKAATQEEGV